jgi:hypothetical protein
MSFELTIPRDRAREFEWDLSRKDADTGVPSPIPETADVSAWLSLTEDGEPITPGSVVVLTRRPLELRSDARRLWFGILERDAVTEALDDLAMGDPLFEVVEVDGERDSREITVED